MVCKKTTYSRIYLARIKNIWIQEKNFHKNSHWIRLSKYTNEELIEFTSKSKKIKKKLNFSCTLEYDQSPSDQKKKSKKMKKNQISPVH